MEEWKFVKNSNIYEISSIGRVRNSKTFKILKPFIVKLGNYESFKIKLKINNKRKTYAISRLVATSFLENKEFKPQVDHINRNPKDDRIENLRWATCKENSNNRGRYKKREISFNTISKITSLYTQGYSNDEIYKKLNEKVI